ncbi:hypothetical protein VK792_15010 [Mesobacterium sp. TK19101]|uniref:Secreted protein n=1 Tax=Mesobacterium hydrothermale TaxID=3111907 RepID=A0ABU6HL73_9RHOB|nr:hypothetical protein [Mesobacterium sp. TK19101]MEC3862600.1 hypothetical protein [Mesobacterium sp. TK19101]
MRMFPRLGTLLLVLVLALTSQELAVARGASAGVEQITICSAQGLVAIELDADGNPTGPAHICPDGVAALFAGADQPITLQTVALRWAPVVRGDAAQVPQSAEVSAATARGPPVPV